LKKEAVFRERATGVARYPERRKGEINVFTETKKRKKSRRPKKTRYQSSSERVEGRVRG